MIKKDYYRLLGISRTAKVEEIKRAYRRLAHQYHPDKNPGNKAAEEHFKSLAEAYGVLQDNGKRAAYDRAYRAQESVRIEDLQSSGDFFGDRDPFTYFFEGVLEDFFGTRRSRPRRSPRSDLCYQLEIPLEEAASGALKSLRVPRIFVCPLCQGTRCAPGTGTIPCPSCRGAGVFRDQKGFFIVDTTCGRCQGRGEIIACPCSHCGGRGHLQGSRTIQIQIPPGVDNGTRLRIRGQGDVSRPGGLPGDLFIEMAVKRHPFFQRVGDDLYYTATVAPREAKKGTTVEVPTLTSKNALKIPAGTAAGQVFVLKGQGMPSLDGRGRGDQKITIQVGKLAVRR
ncbi:MAG: J domain-containing protein [Deltaproteobacteria bacterium]|nr:J domain-containing protein [Deltaproteobacteria bacterium]